MVKGLLFCRCLGIRRRRLTIRRFRCLRGIWHLWYIRRFRLLWCLRRSDFIRHIYRIIWFWFFLILFIIRVISWFKEVEEMSVTIFLRQYQNIQLQTCSYRWQAILFWYKWTLSQLWMAFQILWKADHCGFSA